MNDVFRESGGTIAGVSRILLSPTASTSSATLTTPTAAPQKVKKRAASPDKSVENAVYNHIRAIRALGRTDIFPSEIASALGLSAPAVMSALTSLQSKGVKFGK